MNLRYWTWAALCDLQRYPTAHVEARIAFIEREAKNVKHAPALTWHGMDQTFQEGYDRLNKPFNEEGSISVNIVEHPLRGWYCSATSPRPPFHAFTSSCVPSHRGASRFVFAVWVEFRADPRDPS